MGVKQGISLGQRQSQRLEQRLSPQVIQYIKLLTKTSLELEQRIKEEIEENPVLEQTASDDDEGAGRTQVTDGSDTADSNDYTNSEDDWDWEYYHNNSDDLYGHKARVDRGDELSTQILAPVRSSLSDELLEQLTLSDLDEVERDIATQIIGSIDDDGYLRRALESIADDIAFSRNTHIGPEDVERVLHKVQRFDPVGIAARGLQECLLVQLDVLPKTVPGRDEAIRILREEYKAFTMKHFDHIQKRLKMTSAELKVAFDLIQSLNPKPGEGEVNLIDDYIIPDFEVRNENGSFEITLNRRNSPTLRVSRHYRDMYVELDREKQNGRASKKLDAGTRRFLKSKLEAARWFINSIEQRRNTLLKVMHAIVARQAKFFQSGPGHLRPMILKDIAELIEMDISTVSRVVNGKYVQTEFGVFELKYFFSEGLTTESGDTVSNREVKNLIAMIIDQEDKDTPLSDQAIAELLAEQGFKIARRTVSKYREQLGVPVARMRREVLVG